jgi:DNA-directed RNA polymerase subunit RPC12/RpoP
MLPRIHPPIASRPEFVGAEFGISASFNRQGEWCGGDCCGAQCPMSEIADHLHYAIWVKKTVPVRSAWALYRGAIFKTLLGGCKSEMTMIEKPRWKARFTASSALLLLLSNALLGQPKYATEIYQDFRGKRPLIPEFRLQGPDVDAVTMPEDAGLRITLPKTRKVNQALQIAANFTITGNFEVTGTYDLLSADMPTNGYGVGVSLNIATTDDLRKFLKMSRVMRPEPEHMSVYMAEYWTKGANDWRGPREDTERRSGQLRLVREGSAARCQVSEGPGKEFKTILEKEDFGTEDMVHLRFEVAVGNKSAYAVDARLVDLRVRYGNGAAALNVPVNNPLVPIDPNAAPRNSPKAETRGILSLMLAGALVITLAIASALGLFLYFRGRGAEKKTPEKHSIVTESAVATEIVTFACSSCGKKLKTNVTMAGKNMKCPQCGKAVLVPLHNDADV